MELKKLYEKISYNREYNEKNYDRISLTVQKGKKEEIREYAKEKYNESVNAYINRLIAEDMETKKGQAK